LVTKERKEELDPEVTVDAEDPEDVLVLKDLLVEKEREDTEELVSARKINAKWEAN